MLGRARALYERRGTANAPNGAYLPSRMTPVTLGAGWPRKEPFREGLEPRSANRHDRPVSLKDLLDQAGSLPLPAALLMFDDVLGSLEKIQSTGTVHGEVSLAGVTVDQFGHCHLHTDDEHGAAYVSGRGGTHRYAAPEVRRGGSVTATADTYAATAVFAESVTGSPPDVAHDVITTDPAGAVAPENPVPPPVRLLVDVGMASDEARRPPTAAALRDALNSAGTAAFPTQDWRARGRAWLAKAATAAAPAAPAAPAVATPFRMPASPAPVTNFSPRIDAASAGAAAAAAASAPGRAVGIPSFAGSTATTAAASAASAAASVPTPAPMPWTSQVPSFTPAERPRYDWEDDRLPALPGFFRRLGRGDPGIVSGCGISVIGFILLIIGVSVGMNLSGPNNASASPGNTPAASASDSSSDSGAGATPPAVGTSLAPGLAGSEEVSPSPGPSSAASSAASPSPAPTDTGAPSFTPYPTFTPPPTAAPTPTPSSCLLIC